MAEQAWQAAFQTKMNRENQIYAWGELHSLIYKDNF